MADLEQSIIEELPQIPYVIDQIGQALSWAKEVLTEGEYNKVLEVAWSVTKFAKETSELNFFKTHLVIASILSYIPNALEDQKFAVFDTASKAVEKTLKAITINPKLTEERGCFKSIALTLVPLAKQNEDYFTVMLLGIKQELNEILKGMKPVNVKAPITSTDYITVLGYANVMANLRMSNLKLLDKTYKVFNDIEIILNSEFNY